MNAGPQFANTVAPNQEHIEGIIGRALQQPERIEALNTVQVKDYSRYDMAGFSAEAKQQWREEHWQQDLQNASDAGRRMAEKIIAE